MSNEIYLMTLTMFFGTVIAIFAMRYHAANQQARARLANDEAYRKLADDAAAAQAATAGSLAAIQASLDDLKLRVSAIDTILKQVE